MVDDKEKAREFYQAVEELVKQERVLRETLGIGERYKAVASRIDALFKYMHQVVNLPQQEEAPKRASPALSENERYVFVYLFNAKGKVLARWEAMLSPRSLFEYSVNRPIYSERKHVETYIRSRSDSEEHAFLMMKVAQSDVLQDADSAEKRDSLGAPLLKLKEGALKEQGLVYFFHNSGCYIFLNGHLVLHPE